MTQRSSAESAIVQGDILPSMITVEAADLIDCEVASTCGSDTDPVILYDNGEESTSVTMGGNVLIRNLHPDISSDLIEESLKSRIGLRVYAVHCPSFRVARLFSRLGGTDGSDYMEFNFGFAVISLPSVDEALSLNYIIQSHGGVEEFFLTPRDGDCVSPVSTCDEYSHGFYNELSNTMTTTCITHNDIVSD